MFSFQLIAAWIPAAKSPDTSLKGMHNGCLSFSPGVRMPSLPDLSPLLHFNRCPLPTPHPPSPAVTSASHAALKLFMPPMAVPMRMPARAGSRSCAERGREVHTYIL